MRKGKWSDSWKQRVYAERIAAGVCILCNNAAPISGQQKCEPCAARYREMAKAGQKKRYQTRKAAGQCVTCGGIPEPGRIDCPACKGRRSPHQRVNNKRSYAKQLAAGVCPTCKRRKPEAGKKTCKPCRDRLCEYRARRAADDKEAAFRVYGGYRCDCCGETHVEFLQIDHIGGGGGEHRRSDPSASRLYSWLRRHGYPEGFRVLCCNCNWAYGRHGYCPHQPDKDVDHAHRPWKQALTSPAQGGGIGG